MVLVLLDTLELEGDVTKAKAGTPQWPVHAMAFSHLLPEELFC
uniref:Uncharacterized protein n=1 Tax=Rhizophora mucronata TaxID=61149 RepID=A0A2P2JUC5_RHIMU